MKSCSNCNSEQELGFHQYRWWRSDLLAPADKELFRCAECGIGFTESEYDELEEVGE